MSIIFRRKFLLFFSNRTSFLKEAEIKYFSPKKIPILVLQNDFSARLCKKKKYDKELFFSFEGVFWCTEYCQSRQFFLMSKVKFIGWFYNIGSLNICIHMYNTDYVLTKEQSFLFHVECYNEQEPVDVDKWKLLLKQNISEDNLKLKIELVNKFENEAKIGDGVLYLSDLDIWNTPTKQYARFKRNNLCSSFWWRRYGHAI